VGPAYALISTRDWNARDHWAWITTGALCAVIITIVDESMVSAVAWLIASVARSYHGMPAIFRLARRLSESRRSFLLYVALGWALIPGPLVGSLFGTLCPVILDLPISSFAGGLLGLIVGPVLAALEGVILVTGIAFISRMATGKSLFDQR
jgi:hypothetical protein